MCAPYSILINRVLQLCWKEYKQCRSPFKQLVILGLRVMAPAQTPASISVLRGMAITPPGLTPRTPNSPRKYCRAPTATERRTFNWEPTIWNNDFVKSLNNEYRGGVHVKRATVLKDQVRQLLDPLYEEQGSLALLEFVNDLHRLGLGNIFEQDIHRVLGVLHQNNIKVEETLHATALCFRIMRESGFKVSPDVFKVFKDAEDNFSEHLSQDIKGLLSLFEATHLAIDGEDILVEARAFARKHLSDVKGITDPNLSNLVAHAFDLPLHYNVIRLEARWYIDAYSKRKDANTTLLELAKLDYNMVQAIYQDELVDLSKWWDDLGLAKKLPFSRDRLVECYLWAAGVAGEPQYRYCREGLTKIYTLVTTIDDVYDIYATLDEARLFTDLIERWDVNAMDQLPEYMKLPFFALYNTVNEFSYNALNEQCLDILPSYKKKWADQMKAYMLDAQWVHTCYKPTLKEYIKNACLTSTGPLISMHTYVFMTHAIKHEALNYIDTYPGIVHSLSLIYRLVNDLGTSKDEIERGDDINAIQCYMSDNGVTEEIARQKVRDMIDEEWTRLNTEFWAGLPLPHDVLKVFRDSVRTVEMFYQYGDGYGKPESDTKDRISAFIVRTITM